MRRPVFAAAYFADWSTQLHVLDNEALLPLWLALRDRLRTVSPHRVARGVGSHDRLGTVMHHLAGAHVSPRIPSRHLAPHTGRSQDAASVCPT